MRLASTHGADPVTSPPLLGQITGFSGHSENLQLFVASGSTLFLNAVSLANKQRNGISASDCSNHAFLWSPAGGSPGEGHLGDPAGAPAAPGLHVTAPRV